MVPETIGAQAQKLPRLLIAITIESSLDVQRAINGLPNGTIVETSVGDHGSATLMEHDHELKVGAEPSGHVVLPQSFKPGIGHWGDGISTMIRFLEIINSYGPNWMDKIPPMSGFSLTRSVSPSNRRLWDPRGKIGSSAVTCVSDFLTSRILCQIKWRSKDMKICSQLILKMEIYGR